MIGQLDAVAGFINVCVNLKSSLIDSEAYSESHGNEAQAKAA